VSGNLDRLTAALADRYRLERELGAGGMATVYLAQDLKHDRQVAIKVLRPELAAVIGAERFLVEIKTTANLQHPHILPLHDSGEVNGTVFYVMPFIEGESLRDRLQREKQLPIPEAVRIATEVASALDYAHRHGVIHRDIKPENILLHDGQALVADFGIALAVSKSDGSTRMTETGMSLGTPHYMSPEQAMGERDLDARTDVYALGCVAYEMLVGEPPFSGPTAQAIIAKVMTATPEPISTFRKTVSPAIEDAIHAAIQRLPADRFSSTKEFGNALAATHATTATPTRAVRTGSDAAGRKASRSHPAVWVLGLVALGSLGLAMRQWSVARGADPVPVIRFAVDIVDGMQVTAWNSQNPDLAISPDGRTIAFCVFDAKGARQVYVRRLDEDSGRIVPGTAGSYQPFFSPDGESLAFWVAGRVMKVALSGGAPQAIAEVGNPLALTWSASGDIIYGLRGNTPLMRVPVTGGELRPAAAIDSANGEVAQYYPVALPDGRHVLYQSWGSGAIEDARIGLLDLDAGRARRLDVRGSYPLGMLDDRLVYVDQTGSILSVALDLSSGKVTGSPVILGEGVMSIARGSAVAAVSTTGTLVYVPRGADAALVLANSDGETPVAQEARGFSFPRYSPDGRFITVSAAAGTSSDIWIVDVATGGLTRLTSGGSVNERPEWSPDGKRILFRTVRSGRSAIWWQAVDGSAPAEPLVADDGVDYFEGVLTPDGHAVVFQVDTGGANVFMQSVGGTGGPRPIANTKANEDQARVSPDGEWVAYVTDASGTPQVEVQRLSELGPRFQVSDRGGREPVWSRDGRRIFYRTEEKFWVADVSPAPVFRVTGRRIFMPDPYMQQVSPHANYDVSPDGTRILVVQGEPQQIRVVHNWASEARRRLRAGNRP